MAIYQSGGALIPGGDLQLTGNVDFSKAASVTGVPTSSFTGTVSSSQIAAGAVGGSQLQSSTAIGSSALLVAHATYSFAVDGGAVSTITPASTAALPNKAIIIGGTINFTTAVTSGGSATIAIGTSAGSSTTSILGATAKASATGLLNSAATLASPVELTAAGSITVTVATAALTAGVAEIYVYYIVSAS